MWWRKRYDETQHFLLYITFNCLMVGRNARALYEYDEQKQILILFLAKQLQ